MGTSREINRNHIFQACKFTYYLTGLLVAVASYSVLVLLFFFPQLDRSFESNPLTIVETLQWLEVVMINYRMNCTSLLALNDKSQVYRGTNTLTMLNMVCVDFYSRYDTLKNDLLIKAINRSSEVVLGLKDPSSSR